MIQNDTELKTTQQRIASFQDILLQLRVKATPEEFSYVASGYRSEIEKMQEEVLEYLTRHACDPAQAEDTATKLPESPSRTN